MEEKLKSLLEYVQSDGHICSMPPEWNALWEMLPDKQRIGNSWEPAPPLILAAWDSPILFKIIRFREHIEYAANYGIFDQVDEYLRSLKPVQWFYGD